MENKEKLQCITREDSDWLEVAARWAEIHNQIDLLEKEENLLREKLIEMSGEKNVVGGGIRLVCRERKGAVQYSEIPVLKGLDLEEYRKPPIKTWTLTQNQKT